MSTELNEEHHKVVKSCHTDDTIVLEDGTHISIVKRAKAMGTSSDRLYAIVRRNTPIGKIIIVKRERGGNKL